MRSPAPISFLASVLLFFILSFPLPASAAGCNSADKKALLKIQSDMGHPYIIISWNTHAVGGCCGWVGVKCDAANRVTGLDISNADEAFTIPASIAGLPFLDSLTFHKNPNLTGSIVPAIGKLTRLTFLRLDWNSLSGPVPAFLAKLTSLDYLNLAFNQLSGTIPPFLASLPLSFIRLDRNRLTGPIPASLAKSSSTYLYLSHNGLTGNVPTSFASATKFEVIDLSHNMLSGDGSVLFGAKKVLQSLDLSWNEFEFDLTSIVFPENMTSLILNHNKIYGSIPQQITKLALQSFNVSHNQLCGKIPTGGSLGRFEEYEFFHNKCLCGSPLTAC